MAGLAIYLLLALNLALVIRSQQTFPPVIPTFPPPPTMTSADPPDIDEGPFIPQPPTIIPGDMTVMIGTPTYVIDGFDITLVCNIASGTRPITIRWIRNGASYPAGGNRSTITVPDTDYNDGDDFTCRADNIVGFDEETTMINVFEPPQILPIPFPTPPPGDPDIAVSTGQPMNATITTGSSVTIYCPSSGIDTPGIEWFRNGVMVVAGGRFTISTTTLPGAVITSVLTIDDFQPTDAGTYTCSAINVVGSDDGSTTLLTTTTLPIIAEGQCIPQPEVIPNNDVTVMIGSPAYIADGYDLTITCNVINEIPPMNISWYRNGVLDSSRGNTSTITISDVVINKDNGVVYTCRAENDKRYDEQLTSINVFAPLCSHEICNRRRSILCIIPDSMCLCKPQMGYCSAAYYSTETRSLPETCTRCRIPTDLDCLRMWSQCVKRQDEVAHGRLTRRMRIAANFKIYRHPC